jgi:hypothetical protein
MPSFWLILLGLLTNIGHHLLPHSTPSLGHIQPPLSLNMRIENPLLTSNLPKESTPGRLDEARMVRCILHGLEEPDVLDFEYVRLPLSEDDLVSGQGLADRAFLRNE